MAFAIICELTGATGRINCGCPPGHDNDSGQAHHETCALSDFSSIDLHEVPGCAATCCDQHGQDGHSHDLLECSTEHPAGSCPAPASCKMWLNMRANHPDPDGAGMPEECPGGHHGYGVPGCAVCHPLDIRFIPDPGQPVMLQRADG